MPNTLTAGQLIHQLQTTDPDLPVYLAVNPDWPYAHRVERVVAVSEAAQGAVYIAENGQAGVLPPTVRNEMGWSAT